MYNLRKKNGSFLGVIDVFGGSGGLFEFRAALLASHGFAALALAYFWFDDLPREPSEVNFEYFHEALDWMLVQAKVSSRGVGLVGVSRGSEIVLTLATQRTEIKAVVAISPAFAIMTYCLKYHGHPSDFIPIYEDRLSVANDGSVSLIDGYAYEEADKPNQPGRSALLPMEMILCPLLLVYGTSDRCWNAEYMTQRIVNRMAAHGKESQCEVLRYPNAGHLIEPPYTALCRASYVSSVKLVLSWGGEKRAHALAQEDSWNKLLEFLHNNLTFSAESKL